MKTIEDAVRSLDAHSLQAWTSDIVDAWIADSRRLTKVAATPNSPVVTDEYGNQRVLADLVIEHNHVTRGIRVEIEAAPKDGEMLIYSIDVHAPTLAPVMTDEDPQHDIAVTIDAGGIADATIEGTWQTIRLRSSVEVDPDDSSLTVLDDRGGCISIDCDVLEKALDLLNRFGRTGRLHVVTDPDQDPAVAETLLAIMDGDRDAALVSDVDRHKGVYALSASGKAVRLYGETEMPFTGTAADIQAIADDGACYTRPR